MEGRASSRRGVLLFLLVGVASGNPDGEIFDSASCCYSHADYVFFA